MPIGYILKVLSSMLSSLGGRNAPVLTPLVSTCSFLKG